MTKVNFERRAELGREKRTRTRAQLIAAAKVLYSQRSRESVTIDEVVKEAGVAKGTFLSYFNDLDELAAAVADEVTKSLDEMRRQRAARRARDQSLRSMRRPVELAEQEVAHLLDKCGPCPEDIQQLDMVPRWRANLLGRLIDKFRGIAQPHRGHGFAHPCRITSLRND